MRAEQRQEAGLEELARTLRKTGAPPAPQGGLEEPSLNDLLARVLPAQPSPRHRPVEILAQALLHRDPLERLPLARRLLQAWVWWPDRQAVARLLEHIFTAPHDPTAHTVREYLVLAMVQEPSREALLAFEILLSEGAFPRPRIEPLRDQLRADFTVWPLDERQVRELTNLLFVVFVEGESRQRRAEGGRLGLADYSELSANYHVLDTRYQQMSAPFADFAALNRGLAALYKSRALRLRLGSSPFRRVRGGTDQDYWQKELKAALDAIVAVRRQFRLDVLQTPQRPLHLLWMLEHLIRWERALAEIGRPLRLSGETPRGHRTTIQQLEQAFATLIAQQRAAFATLEAPAAAVPPATDYAAGIVGYLAGLHDQDLLSPWILHSGVYESLGPHRVWKVPVLLDPQRHTVRRWDPAEPTPTHPWLQLDLRVTEGLHVSLSPQWHAPNPSVRIPQAFLDAMWVYNAGGRVSPDGPPAAGLEETPLPRFKPLSNAPTADQRREWFRAIKRAATTLAASLLYNRVQWEHVADTMTKQAGYSRIAPRVRWLVQWHGKRPTDSVKAAAFLLPGTLAMLSEAVVANQRIPGADHILAQLMDPAFARRHRWHAERMKKYRALAPDDAKTDAALNMITRTLRAARLVAGSRAVTASGLEEPPAIPPDAPLRDLADARRALDTVLRPVLDELRTDLDHLRGLLVGQPAPERQDEWRDTVAKTLHPDLDQLEQGLTAWTARLAPDILERASSPVEQAMATLRAAAQALGDGRPAAPEDPATRRLVQTLTRALQTFEAAVTLAPPSATDTTPAVAAPLTPPPRPSPVRPATQDVRVVRETTVAFWRRTREVYYDFSNALAALQRLTDQPQTFETVSWRAQPADWPAAVEQLAWAARYLRDVVTRDLELVTQPPLARAVVRTVWEEYAAPLAVLAQAAAMPPGLETFRRLSAANEQLWMIVDEFRGRLFLPGESSRPVEQYLATTPQGPVMRLAAIYGTGPLTARGRLAVLKRWGRLAEEKSQLFVLGPSLVIQSERAPQASWMRVLRQRGHLARKFRARLALVLPGAAASGRVPGRNVKRLQKLGTPIVRSPAALARLVSQQTPRPRRVELLLAEGESMTLPPMPEGVTVTVHRDVPPTIEGVLQRIRAELAAPTPLTEWQVLRVTRLADALQGRPVQDPPVLVTPPPALPAPTAPAGLEEPLDVALWKGLGASDERSREPFPTRGLRIPAAVWASLPDDGFPVYDRLGQAPVVWVRRAPDSPAFQVVTAGAGAGTIGPRLTPGGTVTEGPLSLQWSEAPTAGSVFSGDLVIQESPPGAYFLDGRDLSRAQRMAWRWLAAQPFPKFPRLPEASPDALTADTVRQAGIALAERLAPALAMVEVQRRAVLKGLRALRARPADPAVVEPEHLESQQALRAIAAMAHLMARDLHEWLPTVDSPVLRATLVHEVSNRLVGFSTPPSYLAAQVATTGWSPETWQRQVGEAMDLVLAEQQRMQALLWELRAIEPADVTVVPTESGALLALVAGPGISLTDAGKAAIHARLHAWAAQAARQSPDLSFLTVLGPSALAEAPMVRWFLTAPEIPSSLRRELIVWLSPTDPAFRAALQQAGGTVADTPEAVVHAVRDLQTTLPFERAIVRYYVPVEDARRLEAVLVPAQLPVEPHYDPEEPLTFVELLQTIFLSRVHGGQWPSVAGYDDAEATWLALALERLAAETVPPAAGLEEGGQATATPREPTRADLIAALLEPKIELVEQTVDRLIATAQLDVLRAGATVKIENTETANFVVPLLNDLVPSGTAPNRRAIQRRITDIIPGDVVKRSVLPPQNQILIQNPSAEEIEQFHAAPTGLEEPITPREALGRLFRHGPWTVTGGVPAGAPAWLEVPPATAYLAVDPRGAILAAAPGAIRPVPERPLVPVTLHPDGQLTLPTEAPPAVQAALDALAPEVRALNEAAAPARVQAAVSAAIRLLGPAMTLITDELALEAPQWSTVRHAVEAMRVETPAMTAALRRAHPVFRETLRHEVNNLLSTVYALIELPPDSVSVALRRNVDVSVQRLRTVLLACRSEGTAPIVFYARNPAPVWRVPGSSLDRGAAAPSVAPEAWAAVDTAAWAEASVVDHAATFAAVVSAFRRPLETLRTAPDLDTLQALQTQWVLVRDMLDTWKRARNALSRPEAPAAQTLRHDLANTIAGWGYLDFYNERVSGEAKTHTAMAQALVRTQALLWEAQQWPGPAWVVGSADLTDAGRARVVAQAEVWRRRALAVTSGTPPSPSFLVVGPTAVAPLVAWLMDQEEPTLRELVGRQLVVWAPDGTAAARQADVLSGWGLRVLRDLAALDAAPGVTVHYVFTPEDLARAQAAGRATRAFTSAELVPTAEPLLVLHHLLEGVTRDRTGAAALSADEQAEAAWLARALTRYYQ